MLDLVIWTTPFLTFRAEKDRKRGELEAKSGL